MTPAATFVPAPARDAATRRQTTGALVLASALAWGFVLFGPDGMGAGPVTFVAAWGAMMAAMMLPSAAPLVLLYSRGGPARATAALTAGYLLVWTLAGVPAYVAHELLPMAVGPVALAAAGVYQLTPLKTVCLKGCRTPGDFLVQRWDRSAIRLGIEHGAWCLGCCWALMAVLVLVGSMGLLWVVGVAALVAVEKLNRHGVAFARLTGVALLIAALIKGVMLWNGEPMDMS
jgi:predicted metal-binding membrane protein